MTERTDLVMLGWTPDDEESFLEQTEAQIARVVIVHGGHAEVMSASGTENVTETVLFSSTLDTTPVAGDWVAVLQGTIVEVAPRRTSMARPDPGGNRTQVLAANIDLILVVVAADPIPSLNAIERMQVMAWDSGATPVLVLTKADQCSDLDEVLEHVAPVISGLETIVTSITDGRGLSLLHDRVENLTTTMLGASGAGKTSLLNALHGTDAATAPVRRDGQGRHTTTTRRLFPMPRGGVMLDIPGIRSLALQAGQEGISDTFADISELSYHCRFSDCLHERTAGCAVAAAVADGRLSARRLDSWLAVQRELSFQERRRDPAAMAEQRKRWKQATKMSRKSR